MTVYVDQIKKIRRETQAPVMEIKRALEEAGGNEVAAKKLLTKKALVRAQKKKERKTGDGYIFSYIHPGGKVGVLLELRCE
ncbi:elongation factor Ts, partial [Candidatus Saccharibacteria bacterium]|nr:elongation factor Ts [Candidatus Saccharibacteria bacterium]